LSAIALLSTSLTFAQINLYTESFESDGFGTEYTMNRFSDGAQDYFGVVDLNGNTQYIAANTTNPFTEPMTNMDGTKCVGGEDFKQIDNPLNTVLDEYRGFFVVKTLDATGHSTVEVKILLGCRSSGTYEGTDNDALRIQYAFDANIATGANSINGLPASTAVNTGTYTDIGRFLASAPSSATMQQDVDLNGTSDGASLGNTMVEYTFTIPVTGTNLSVRVHMDYDDSAEEIAFDNIRITGDNVLSISENELTNNVSFYPNPLEGDRLLHISNNSQNTITSVEIYDVVGKKVLSEVVTTESIQFPDNFPSGVYFVKITDTKNNSVTKKVMLQ
jgi:hypothetical protein